MCYLAPTPVIFPVNHPSGVCNPPLRGVTPPPTPSDSGLADTNDSLLALAAACTVCRYKIRYRNKGVVQSKHHRLGRREWSQKKQNEPDKSISSTLVSNTSPP